VRWAISFQPGRLAFQSYPFAPASVRTEPVILRPWIVGWSATTAPPSLWLESREVLFVHAEQKAELASWCAEHRVPELKPVDVWSLLLEPYLDTEFSADDDARVNDQLASVGLDAREVAALRKRVGSRMLTYNALLWEWIYLGQFDLLQAFQPLNPWFKKLYWESMETAWRGLPS
jgi:hypothetical protein